MGIMPVFGLFAEGEEGDMTPPEDANRAKNIALQIPNVIEPRSPLVKIVAQLMILIVLRQADWSICCGLRLLKRGRSWQNLLMVTSPWSSGPANEMPFTFDPLSRPM
jgi:hypothetical protein